MKPAAQTSATGARALRVVRWDRYIKGYMKSGEDRLAPFYARTRCLRLLFYTTVGGIACSALDSTGGIGSLKAAFG
jgi:hypothetical protein